MLLADSLSARVIPAILPIIGLPFHIIGLPFHITNPIGGYLTPRYGYSFALRADGTSWAWGGEWYMPTNYTIEKNTFTNNAERVSFISPTYL